MDKESLPGLVLFILACMFLAFLTGVFGSIFNLFPYPQLRTLVSELASELSNDDGRGDLHFLYPVRNDASGLMQLDKEKAQSGITLVTGMWNDDGSWGAEIRLLDLQGEVLHRWKIHPDEIWPESPHEDLAKNSHNKSTSYVHGSALLPGGDVVFNIEYLGTFRMDACGDVKWKVPLRNHHSIDVDDDGNFWASGLIWREQPVPEFVHLLPPFVEETLVQMSPEGEVLREISIVEALYDSGYQGAIASHRKKLDITHMNDVEVLSAEMADSFPSFNAGDILVSLRNYNLVVVVDGKTEKIKWHFWHPLIHQHDPDFEPDGHIVIFDNNDDTTREGSLWGQTRLLKVDPVTNKYERVYPLSDDVYFYTQEGGKHQLLDNGNRLITEANAGRVIEVTPEGDIVWDWVIEARDGQYLPEVLEGTRYPESAADFINTLSCP